MGEKVKEAGRRSVLLESAKARVADQREKVKKATADAQNAEKAVQSAEPELKEQEAMLEHHREEIRKEAEAMLAEEQGSRGESFAEEIQNMIAGEDDFPDVVEIKGRIANIKSNIADLNLILDETTTALRNEEAQAQLAQAELVQLEEDEKNAEMPPLTAYYCSQELETLATFMKRHEDAQNELMEASKQRREEWMKEKTQLQEELHQAGISIEVAKGDLEVTKAIPKELKMS